MSRSAKDMQMASAKLILDLRDDGFEVSEGMVVLAMTLAIMFRTDNVSQHEAISRFATIAKNVYGGNDE
jgi:hypothetical protein